MDLLRYMRFVVYCEFLILSEVWGLLCGFFLYDLLNMFRIWRWDGCEVRDEVEGVKDSGIGYIYILLEIYIKVLKNSSNGN